MEEWECKLALCFEFNLLTNNEESVPWVEPQVKSRSHWQNGPDS